MEWFYRGFGYRGLAVTRAEFLLNLIEDINSKNVMDGAEIDDLHRDDEEDEGDHGNVDIEPSFGKTGELV